LIARVGIAAKDLDRLQLFVQVSGSALRQATRAVYALELSRRLYETSGSVEEFADEAELGHRRDEAGRIESFASDQSSIGFSYLYELALVKLWSILEVLVDDVFVESLRCHPSLADLESLSKVKGPLVQFMSLDRDQQAEYLADRVKQELLPGASSGAGRFEALLTPIGLGGGLPDYARRSLHEMGQVRNVIVHRGGVIDVRLNEACPWLPFRPGDSVQVSIDDFYLYWITGYHYALELKRRVLNSQNDSVPSNLEDILSETAEIIRETWLNRHQPRG
jgi:hypothetical protein